MGDVRSSGGCVVPITHGWLSYVSLTVALLASLTGAGWAEDTHDLPCGVEAVVGMARIMGQEIDEGTIEELAGHYPPPNSMSLLDVTRELNARLGVKSQVWRASWSELLGLDQPHVVHLLGTSGCSDCPGGGHVVAVERLSGQWATIVQHDGPKLISAEQLRHEYGGDAVLLTELPFAGPVGPRLVFDSYVSDLGNILAGQPRPCRLTLRNQGTAPLRISRVEAKGSVECLGATAALAPGEVGEIELSICPRHRLDRPSDTRTFFVHVRSNDPIRPRTSVALRCTVVEAVIVKSPVVYFPRVTATQSGERTIALECRPPVKLLNATPSHPAVTVEIEETGETLSGTHYQLRLTVRGETLQPGIVEIPIALQLEGVESEGAELIARVRVWPD
ncbi:MAG: DUF1573 domain-containing protein [Armatimonadota bacterium]|nr:MAG: DUF1573 domain-containing protein [Armatimonadota bacterium]